MPQLPKRPDRPITPEGRRNRLVRKSKRIVWYGSEKPSKKLSKKYKVGKAGSGPLKGYYVALKKTPKKPPKPTGPTVGNGTQVGVGPGNTGTLTPPAAPAAPAGPTGPYSDLPEWARNYMLGYDTQAQHHQNYVTGQVMPWLSEALKGVGQFSEAAQGQIQNTGNAGAGALQVAANAGTPNVAPVAPGAGPFQGDQAYQLNAANTAAGAISGAMQDRNKYNADMSRFGLQNQSSAVLTSMGQFAAGLPAAYSQRRNERLLEIRNYVERERQFNETQARLKYQYDNDMALAQERFKEDQRRYGIEFAYRQFNDARNAAISQLNANNGLILGLGSLGLKGTELAAELGQQPPTAPSSVPPGFTVIPTDDGGYEVVRDPTVPAATSGGNDGGNNGLSPTTTAKSLGPWNVRPKGNPPRGYKYVKNPDDGKWYGVQIQGARGSGAGSGGGTPDPATDISGDFRTYWQDEVRDGGLGPAQGRKAAAAWIYNRRGRGAYGGSRIAGKNGRVNRTAILKLVTETAGGPAYVSPNGKQSPYSNAAVAVWNTLVADGFVVKRNGNYFWKQ